MNKRTTAQRISSQPFGKRKQTGYSLIEALVAFLILSIGMLGVASLQTMSVKAGHTATLRSAAVMKADEILESMRANSTVLLGYAAGTGDSGTDNGCSQTTVAAVVCAPALQALDDIFRWKRSLTDVLPNNTSTTASVAVTPPVPPETMTNIVVTINWSERDVDGGGAATMNYSVTTQM